MPDHDVLSRTSANSEEVRAEIEKAREKITVSALELRHELTVATDWRHWVERRPMLFVLGALSLGMLLGKRRRTVDVKTERLIQQLASSRRPSWEDDDFA